MFVNATVKSDSDGICSQLQQRPISQEQLLDEVKRGIQKLYEQIRRQCQTANLINDLLRIDIKHFALFSVYVKASQAG